MNNIFKRLTLILLIAALGVCITACDFDESKNHYFGGTILDDGLMESIKDALITETESEAESATDEPTTESDEITTETETEAQTDSNTVVTTDVTETDTNEATEDTDKPDTTPSSTVYWTESGETWHTNPKCYHIKNKDVFSGSVEEAIEAGKERLCKTCAK